jgi:hypothetical protein
LKSSAKNINLTSVDDLFTTEESRIDDNREKVQEIPLSELYTFKDHPFKVIDNEAMYDTAESVKQYGVLIPAIARPRDEGGYELVAGHRRKRACELAELTTMPVIVRNLDDGSVLESGAVFPQELHKMLKTCYPPVRWKTSLKTPTSSICSTKRPATGKFLRNSSTFRPISSLM